MAEVAEKLRGLDEFPNSTELTDKLIRLQAHMANHLNDGVVIAFSGGIDSAFLLWIANGVRKKFGGNFLALTTSSASMPQTDVEDAKRFAAKLGVEHVWKDSTELQQSEYIRNDIRRCYYCKSELFSIAETVAKEWNYRWIIYGYNASDRGDFRPGHKAAQERGVLFPLADIGFTKEEIRTIMRQNDIKLAEKPASPCLSSRIMHGIPITSKNLRDIDHIESILRHGGVKIYRVRLCAEKNFGFTFLRIEVDPKEMPRVLTIREKIVQEGQKRGYPWVTLDLGGYRTGGGTGGT